MPEKRWWWWVVVVGVGGSKAEGLSDAARALFPDTAVWHGPAVTN